MSRLEPSEFHQVGRVLVTRELVGEMAEEFGPPVHVRIRRQGGDEVDLAIYRCAGPVPGCAICDQRVPS